MDRSLRKGVIGLSVLWLSKAPLATHKEHIWMKEELSLESALDERKTARDSLQEKAAGSADIRELFTAECDHRGGDRSEPVAISCPPVLYQLARLNLL